MLYSLTENWPTPSPVWPSSMWAGWPSSASPPWGPCGPCPGWGKTATLYTHLNVREDALDLFGFATQGELTCFKLLTAISGVGPKVGIAILSELTPEDVALAAAAGDAKRFTPGQRRRG